MRVHVLFFGVLKDLAGRSSDTLSLPDHAVARDVRTHYAQRLSAPKGILDSIAISVNQEYARPEDELSDGDEVALLPPVSGGATNVDPAPNVSQSQRSRAFITREKIDTAGIVDAIKCPEDGAAVVFEGIVRNNSRGRRTLFLDYEAYEEMALKQMEALIAQAMNKDQFAIRDAVIVHRLGRLEIGETSVLVVVASAHRAAAFDACRWLIDTLKHTVPIWKKEHFENGAVWSDGEPFPGEIAATNLGPPEHNGKMEVRASLPVGKRTTVGSETTGSYTAEPASNPIARK